MPRRHRRRADPLRRRRADGGADQPAAGAGQPRGARGARRRASRADLQQRIDALDIDADEHPARGPARGSGTGAGRARRARHGRHRTAREPVGQPRRARRTSRSASPGSTSCCGRAASVGRCWRSFRCSSRSVCRRSIVWMLDITLSPLTTVSGPLVVASVAEFSVLIMGRHIEERQDGLGPDEAIHTAARRTGRAFFTSALHDHRRLRRADLVVAAAAARLRH